ncbi:hypothetical protein BU25DRAFT_419649 [Macroventuria anomochaeta]|uniref:Uncharacterized protein n=1 Tax=Macroventuria anomochaeta TaxID=301207 RepID=A0ACB6S7R2_9PLEO|nr:uncharacterized protein BU25DRAFT_419649 [Macroventuria anomochaeta]KAF2629998.1 hypothetical protein BU25DRAFT_419649 [Macroventuria anomochaeta]
MKSLVLQGTGQSTLSSRFDLPRLHVLTEFKLFGLVFCQDNNLESVLKQQLRKLAFVDCSIILRIKSGPGTLGTHPYMRHTTPDFIHYEVDLRWSMIFTLVQASSVQKFSFGQTQCVDGQGEVVEGIEPDHHYCYNAYEFGNLTSCPFDVRTFRTIFENAAGLIKLQQSKGQKGKADETVEDHEQYPLFLKLAGARNSDVEGMKN